MAASGICCGAGSSRSRDARMTKSAMTRYIVNVITAANYLVFQKDTYGYIDTEYLNRRVQEMRSAALVYRGYREES